MNTNGRVIETELAHFEAVFLQGEFNVTVTVGKIRLFEKMPIAKFLRLAREQDKPLRVDGIVVEFRGKGARAEKWVRSYLKQVADTYVQAFHRNN